LIAAMKKMREQTPEQCKATLESLEDDKEQQRCVRVCVDLMRLSSYVTSLRRVMEELHKWEYLVPYVDLPSKLNEPAAEVRV
jgi:hypothetical protein